MAPISATFARPSLPEGMPMVVPRWWARYVPVAAVIVAALALLVVISSGRAAVPQVAGVALSGVTEIDAESFLRIAQEDAWVKSQTARTDSRVVEIVDPIDGKSGPIVWIVDYTGGRALAVELTKPGDAVASRSIASIDTPNISPAEKQVAADAALADVRVRTLAGDGVSLVVNNTTGSSAGSCAESRCLAVFLTPPDGDYTGLIVAVVDLRTSTVTEILP